MHSVPKTQTPQAAPSSVIVTEGAKKEENVIEKTEETKSKEIVAEPTPETVQKTPEVLAVAKTSEITQKPVVRQNAKDEKVAEPLALTATAQESGTHIPMPVIIGSIAGIGILGFVVRKFLFKFR